MKRKDSMTDTKHKHVDVVFILLKMLNYHFNIYEQDKFHAQLTHISLASFLLDIGKQCKMRHLIRFSTVCKQKFLFKLE